MTRRRGLGSFANAALNFSMVGSSRNFGNGSSAWGKSPGKIKVLLWRVVVVPVTQPLEERAQCSESIADGHRRQRFSRFARPSSQPEFEGLDVTSLDVGHGMCTSDRLRSPVRRSGAASARWQPPSSDGLRRPIGPGRRPWWPPSPVPGGRCQAKGTPRCSTTVRRFLSTSEGRSSGHLRRCREGFHGLAVLLGQPVDAEVQVDPGRRNRAMSGLGLDGFDGHPGFAQSGEAGVSELMTGAVDESSPRPGGAEDLDDPLARERLPTTRALERDEQPIGLHIRWSLLVHVVRHRGEEGG